ncbi:unnamed protein product [Rotaria sp. Silwood2]|nr:unnamed protein product [Rotaria sp. Silwood2]CAF4287605.1 unnamed protein product [Rotaria sp. Silwood2]
MIEKEALTISYCATRMKLYLLGREFIVATDNCPLRDMHKKPSNNRRVDRKCNCMTDYLTRYSRQLEHDDAFLDSDFGILLAIENDVDKKPINNYDLVASSFISAVTTRAQAKAQAHQIPSNSSDNSSNHVLLIDDSSQQEGSHDSDITKIVEAQKEDKLCQEKILELNKNPLHYLYILENDILYKTINHGMFTQRLIYIPSSMIQQLLYAYHDSPWAGHVDYYRRCLKLKDKYWWPNMKFTIKNYIETCMLYQRFNIDRKKPAGPFPVTPQGNKYVLAITDYFTKWVIAIYAFMSTRIYHMVYNSSKVKRSSKSNLNKHRRINKEEKERTYQQLLPPYQPIHCYSIFFINHSATPDELTYLIDMAERTLNFIIHMIFAKHEAPRFSITDDEKLGSSIIGHDPDDRHPSTLDSMPVQFQQYSSVLDINIAEALTTCHK